MFGGLGEDNFVETALDVLETDERYIHIAIKLNEAFARTKANLPTLKNIEKPQTPENVQAPETLVSPPGVSDRTMLSGSKISPIKNFFSFAPLPDTFVQKQLIRRQTRLF